MFKCAFPVLFSVSLCKVSVTKYSGKYEARSESIQPFWISREAVAWPWCNVAASQRRPYCATMNSRSPVRLVSRQWDVVDWTCVLCGRPIHNDWASRSANLHQYACSFYSSRVGFFFFFWQNTASPRSVSTPTGQIWLPATSGFSQTKIAVESEEICEGDHHTVHKLIQRGLTAGWLAQRESDCSRLHSKVSSNWLPSYIKTISRFSKWLDNFRTAFV